MNSHNDEARAADTTAAWNDYVHDVGPTPADRRRVRAAFDRRVRRSSEAMPEPRSRAAAAVLLFKSSATAVALAACVLGGVGGAARLLAPSPAEPPAIVDAAPAAAARDAARGAAPQAEDDAAPNAGNEAASDAPRLASVVVPEPPPTAVAVDRTAPLSSPRSPAVAAAVHTIAPPVAAPPRDALKEELELIESARAAVTRRDHDAALRALAGHARRFAGGALVEEREALTAIVACRKKSADAPALAARFVDEHPRSPMRDHVRDACASLSPMDRATSPE